MGGIHPAIDSYNAQARHAGHGMVVLLRTFGRGGAEELDDWDHFQAIDRHALWHSEGDAVTP